MKLLALAVSLLLVSEGWSWNCCVRINVGSEEYPFLIPKNTCSSLGPSRSAKATCDPKKKTVYYYDNSDCSGSPSETKANVPLGAGEFCSPVCVAKIDGFADDTCTGTPETTTNLVPNQCLGGTKLSCLGGQYLVSEYNDKKDCSGEVNMIAAGKLGKCVFGTKLKQCVGGTEPTLPDTTPGQGKFILAEKFTRSCVAASGRKFLQISFPGKCNVNSQKLYCLNGGNKLVILSYGPDNCGGNGPVVYEKITDLSCAGGMVYTCNDASLTTPPPVSTLGTEVVIGDRFSDASCTKKYGQVTIKLDTCFYKETYTCKDSVTMVIKESSDPGCGGSLLSEAEVPVDTCVAWRGAYVKIVSFCPKDATTLRPTNRPTTADPTMKPTPRPTPRPSDRPTDRPTNRPTPRPSRRPTPRPSRRPTPRPSRRPTRRPSKRPTRRPTKRPTKRPTVRVTRKPTPRPTKRTTAQPTWGYTTTTTRRTTWQYRTTKGGSRQTTKSKDDDDDDDDDENESSKSGFGGRKQGYGGGY